MLKSLGERKWQQFKSSKWVSCFYFTLSFSTCPGFLTFISGTPTYFFLSLFLSLFLCFFLSFFLPFFLSFLFFLSFNPPLSSSSVFFCSKKMSWHVNWSPTYDVLFQINFFFNNFFSHNTVKDWNLNIGIPNYAEIRMPACLRLEQFYSHLNQAISIWMLSMYCVCLNLAILHSELGQLS